MSPNFLQLPFYDRYKVYLHNSLNYSTKETMKEIPKLQSLMASTIISELIEALFILNQGRINFNRVEQHITLTERYQHEYREKHFDEQTLEPMMKALQRISLVKLEKEIEVLHMVLVDLSIELKTTSTFVDLQTKVNKFADDAKTEYDFIKVFVHNNNRITELKLETKQKIENGEKLLKIVRDEITNVESHIYDIQIQNELKFSLVSKWEQTRHQQANIILNREDTRLLQMCDEYKMKIDREQIAIYDIQNFLKFQIAGLSERIEEWIERYAKDVKELDIKIAQLKEAMQDVKSKSESITKKYDSRQIDISEYREEQRILEEKRKLEEKQCNSAIRIQSWWRGVMVRMELGPYRPKKPKKKLGKNK